MRKGIAVGTVILLVLSMVALSVGVYFVNKSKESLKGPIQETTFRKYCNVFVSQYECNMKKAPEEFRNEFDKACNDYLKYKGESNIVLCKKFCGCDKFEKLKKWGEKFFGEEEMISATCHPDKGYCDFFPSELFMLLQDVGNQLTEEDIPSTGRYIEFADPYTGKSYNCFALVKDKSGNKYDLNLVFEKGDSEKAVNLGKWFIGMNKDKYESIFDKYDVDDDDFKYAYSGSDYSIADETRIDKRKDQDFYYPDCSGDCSERSYFRILVKKIDKGTDVGITTLGSKKLTYVLEDCPMIVDTKNYAYRKKITVKERSGNVLQDYVIEVTVDTKTPIAEGKMKPDCSDIRFANENDEFLDFFIKPGTCGKSNTKIWIKIPEIDKNSEKTIYMYYGNPNAKKLTINPREIFLAYDDFENPDDVEGKIDYTGITTIKENENNNHYLNVDPTFGILHLKDSWCGTFFITYDTSRKEGYSLKFEFRYPDGNDDTLLASIYNLEPKIEDKGVRCDDYISPEKTNGGFSITFEREDDNFVSYYLDKYGKHQIKYIANKKSNPEWFQEGWHTISISTYGNKAIVNLDDIRFETDVNEGLRKGNKIVIGIYNSYNNNIFEKIKNKIITPSRNYALDNIIITPYVYPEPEVKIFNEETNPSYSKVQKPGDQCDWSGIRCGKVVNGEFYYCIQKDCEDIIMSASTGCRYYLCTEDNSGRRILKPVNPEDLGIG